MPGFAEHERTYLMQLAGSTQYTNVHTAQRRTETLFGGFMQAGRSWSYRMVPKGGTLNRIRQFDSYAELRTAIPSLPERPEPVTIPSLTVLACAIFGNHPFIYIHGKGRYDRRYVKITGYGVETVGSNTRYETRGQTLTPSDKVKDYAYALWGYQFGTLANSVKQLAGHIAAAPDVPAHALLTPR